MNVGSVPPQRWVLLEVGEVVQEGDEAYYCRGGVLGWHPSQYIGEKITCPIAPVRRRWSPPAAQGDEALRALAASWEAKLGWEAATEARFECARELRAILAAGVKTDSAVGREAVVEKCAAWLRANASAEREPKARAAFIEAHNAIREIIRTNTPEKAP